MRRVDRFLTAKIAAGRSERTIGFYQRELAAAAQWMKDNGHDLDSAPAWAIEDYLAAERARGQSPASVSARYRALSAYYRWIHARERRTGEPEIAQVEKPDAGHREPRRTTPDQVEQLLKSIESDTWTGCRDRSLIRILFWSGLRVGEAVGLRVTDVDHRARRLHIKKGKGDKSRSVPYHSKVTPDLLAYLFSRPAPRAEELWIGNDGAGGATPIGLTDNGIRQMLRRRCMAAGMKVINPHALRHGFAMTMLNEGGATMDAVAVFLGHSSPEITRQFYAEYVDEELTAIYASAVNRSEQRRQPGND